ncbi:hypothetical protein [Paraburkholderia rhynchosiae]|uniref:Glycosyltransferase RgtA/B/C/D-like domain-containing protein n=1 Tax=Paraburkholderia rhynchosiae TaxID=487049 RepID=A0A2N7WC21_9BURK|nr:hypothetical protein [Paraburkholderia rhynchosiae]PMS26941.1 hypothetical protein C0Z16_26100 [Paraburkholderia rhynchosiae]CAB3727276.1 hypothetical protein LMG27174_05480 [Paraburkholderia rhynchosiae]
MIVRKGAAPGVPPLHVWGLWLIGTLVASVPLFVTSIPPLGQHFYNIVRIDILSHPASYAGNFIVRWDTLPDLAMDLTVPWLASLLPVEWAAWLFVVVELALLTSGCLVLSRAANGRWSWLPFVSFLLLYNWILIRGYDNYLFGLGLCFWAIALHVSLRQATLARIAVSSCTALSIYFCHLFPLAVFALVTGTWELGCLLQEGEVQIRSLTRHAAASLVPLILPIALLAHSSTGGLGGSIDFGVIHIFAKISRWLDVFAVGNPAGDVAILASLGLTLAVGFLLRLWTCKPEFRITIMALPVVALFAPFTAFASYGVVERCALSFAFLLTALVEVRHSAPRVQRVGALVLVLVFAFRIATVTADWRAAKPAIQAYRDTFASLKPGSVLLQYKQDTTYPSPRTAPRRWNPYLDKVVALATLDGVLVPDLYLKAGHQPVLYRGENAALREFQDDIENGDKAFRADDRMLHAWTTELQYRFPDLQSRFTGVYLAVFDPSRRLSESLSGWQLVATLPEHRLYELLPR